MPNVFQCSQLTSEGSKSFVKALSTENRVCTTIFKEAVFCLVKLNQLFSQLYLGHLQCDYRCLHDSCIDIPKINKKN